MALRILACFFMLALTAPALSDGPHWSFYPTNVVRIDSAGNPIDQDSGLKFYFVNPPSQRASVTAIIIDCGKERTVSGDIDTASRAETLLRFAIGSLDGFKVRKLTLNFGHGAISVDSPQASDPYTY